MDRGTRRLFVVALVVLVAVVGLATVILGAPPADGGPPGTTAADGVIVGVESEGLTAVRSFELRLADGTIRAFRLDQLENGVEFPPGHLVEHSVTAEPVRVWYREGPGFDWAIRLEDASPAAASSAPS